MINEDALQVIKQIVTVPATREIRIQLPEAAATHEDAEVIVLFKSVSVNVSEKMAAMREAATDELFLADLHEVAEDFQHADAENHPA